MKKVREKLKKVGVLFIAGLLCFNSFAAVVSDNDGSAFITKAEFDSLKNNFQAQIDSYNTSIDSKIDGAIAAYLAGIRLSNVKDILPIANGDNYVYENSDWFRVECVEIGNGSTNLITTDVNQLYNGYGIVGNYSYKAVPPGYAYFYKGYVGSRDNQYTYLQVVEKLTNMSSTIGGTSYNVVGWWAENAPSDNRIIRITDLSSLYWFAASVHDKKRVGFTDPLDVILFKFDEGGHPKDDLEFRAYPNPSKVRRFQKSLATSYLASRRVSDKNPVADEDYVGLSKNATIDTGVPDAAKKVWEEHGLVAFRLYDKNGNVRLEQPVYACYQSPSNWDSTGYVRWKIPKDTTLNKGDYIAFEMTGPQSWYDYYGMNSNTGITLLLPQKITIIGE